MDSDSNLRTLKKYIKYGFLKIDNKLSPFKNHASDLTIMKGCVMCRNRVYVTETLRGNIFN